LNWKGDPLRLHYTSTLTDNNNVYGENVGKKVMDEKSQEKKSQEKIHRKKSHIYNVVYKHYDNSNQVASFYKLPFPFKSLWFESFMN
jgi:hypothetical protein